MSDHGMNMRYPATRWQDALPTGSGVVGALMYGRIHREMIVINHDALYYPKKKAVLEDVSDLLPELRRLIDTGRYAEAAELMPAEHAKRTDAEAGSTSSLRDPYQPLCSLRLETPTDGPFYHYRRGVDFSTGLVWVVWTDGTATYRREMFVSRVSDAIYMRIGSNIPESVTATLVLREPANEQASTKQWAGSGDVDLSVLQKTAGDGYLCFSAAYPGGLNFGAEASVFYDGGTLAVADESLVIESSNEIVVKIQPYVGGEGKPEVAAVTPVEYTAAFDEHAGLHGRLFSSVTLDIADDKNDTINQSNEELLIAAYDGDVPNRLIQTMFEYGRYLLVCSSREGGWPANLQGIWNGDYSPAWNSDFHTDENVQMNYWQALPGGLAETALPLFDYFEKWIDDYRENAKKLFGCRGIFVPIAQTTHGGDIPSIWSNWTAAAGWIGHHFYDYYLFTGDLEFLRHRAVPWIKEVALFYEDFLMDGPDGKLLFSPSLSPENRPSGEGMGLLTMNATMDVAVCREVLENLCNAHEVLEIESGAVSRWREMLNRLPEYEINTDGAIKEWLHPSFEDNYHHRHQSHLYPLFPGFQITEESEPRLFEGCRVAVEKRLVIGLTSQTGWSMAHMANIYARLGMGDRSLECLEILTRSSTGPNLFTYHNDWRDMGLSLAWEENPPFQIDANFGIAAAVLEMLVFSKPGTVKILPALPAKWKSGKVTGLVCRGGITVDVEWDRGRRFIDATLTSPRSQPVNLRLPDWFEDSGAHNEIVLEPGVACRVTLD